jgi:hypothetical protein
MSNGDLPECPTGSCGYGALAGSGHCTAGGGDCANAFFKSLDNTTEYHTALLQQATSQINSIFSGLGTDPQEQGRKLSMMRTPRGIALGWVRHGDDPPEKTMISGDDPRVVDELMIDEVGAEGEMCAGRHCSFEIRNEEVFCFEHTETKCWVAVFLEARESDYHPATVREAVKKIKQILSGVQTEAKGRKLSILRTSDGMMLAWTTHTEGKGYQAA